jgi:hypothetical protein
MIGWSPEVIHAAAVETPGADNTRRLIRKTASEHFLQPLQLVTCFHVYVSSCSHSDSPLLHEK